MLKHTIPLFKTSSIIFDRASGKISVRNRWQLSRKDEITLSIREGNFLFTNKSSCIDLPFLPMNKYTYKNVGPFMMLALEPRDSTPMAMYWPNSNFNLVIKINFMTVERGNLND
jgi:hypothetical protein